MENENNICIDDIMQQIKNEIKEKNLTSDMLSFDDVPYKTAEEMNLADKNILQDTEPASIYVNSHYYIQPYKELSGNPFAVFVKKVIRKLTKFYVEPITFEQNEFNVNVVRLINSLRNSENNRNADAEKSDKLLSRIEVLELKQKSLASKIEKLEKENADLKQRLGK